MILWDSLPGFEVVATPEEDGAPDGATLRSPKSDGGTSESTHVRRLSNPATLPATDDERGRTSPTQGENDDWPSSCSAPFSFPRNSSTARAPTVPSLPRLDSTAALTHCWISRSTRWNNSVNWPTMTSARTLASTKQPTIFSTYLEPNERRRLSSTE